MSHMQSESRSRTIIRNLRCYARLAVVALVLSGCANLGSPKPSDRTAVVNTGQWGAAFRGGRVEIVKVEGVEPSWRLHSAMAISAGDHTGLFHVYLCSSVECNNSIARAEIRFRAEAGHIYRPHARERSHGSNVFWVWLVDEATGRVVGGTPPS